MKITPFHDRLAPLNRTQLWEHWAGYLSAIKYQHSVATEYFSIRSGVGAFDTSPLFKYRIAGVDATRFLSGAFVRDIRRCGVGRGQYTAWCDDDGFVLEDGVALRTGEDEYWLTTAKPNLSYLQRLAGEADVTILDVSTRYGILALQGPASTALIEGLAPRTAELAFFGVVETEVAGRSVMVARTGFTGDLGYEVWVAAEDAPAVWDALAVAGQSHNLMPVGARAVTTARLDAGLLLIDVDFTSARYAWTEVERETPDELGLGWMVDLDDDRPFVGRRAIEARRTSRGERWLTVGVRVDAAAYDDLYEAAGLTPPKNGVYVDASQSVYDQDFNADRSSRQVGYVTSFAFSPLLKRHIGIAKLAPAVAKEGSTVYLELTVQHRPRYVPCEVVDLPFFDPPRKSAPRGRL